MPYLKRWPHTYQEDSLANWRAARDNAANQPVDVVYYGNSLTQDGGSPISFIDGGFPAHIGNWMNAKLGKQHGVGFECVRTGQTTSRWTLTNTSGTSVPQGTRNQGGFGNSGFGLWSMKLAPGDSVSLTATFDRFDMLYTKTKTTSGTIEIKLDAVTQASVTTQDAAQSGTTIGTFDASNTWTSDPVALGSHTILLTNTGADFVYIEGVFLYLTNYSSGFRIWNGAHSGFWGGDFTGSPNCFDLLKKRQPALAVWAHFYNDRHFAITGAYKTWAQYFIDYVRTNCPNTDILLATEWEVPNWTPANANSYSAMRQAVFEIAALNNIGVIDLGDFVESCGYNGVYDDPLGWVKNDETHQGSDAGFRQWAKIHWAYLNDVKPPVRPQHL